MCPGLECILVQRSSQIRNHARRCILKALFISKITFLIHISDFDYNKISFGIDELFDIYASMGSNTDMKDFSFKAATNYKRKRNWNEQIKKGGNSDNANYRGKMSMMTGMQKFKMRSHEWGETTIMANFEALTLVSSMLALRRSHCKHYFPMSFTLETLQ